MLSNVRWLQEQRAHLTERPSPLFTQQQSVVTSLVAKWDGMTNDERKRMLADIFDSITASAEGIDRMEPAEDWRPYLIAAIPSPVGLSAERKTGLYVPNVETTRLVRDDRGWLRLAG